MSYNQGNFDSKKNNEISYRLTILTQSQERIIDYIDQLLESGFSLTQRSGCDCFLHLLQKIRLNLESANKLIEFLFNDYRFKTSVNLIYRSIIDDIINVHYLSLLVDIESPDQNSLTNELNILHKEYLQACQQAVEADDKHNIFLKGLNIDVSDSYSNTFMDDIKKTNAHLFDNKGEWKTLDILRLTTNTNIKESLPKKSFISENAKLKFIENSYGRASTLKSIFKYYSQYQHYTPNSYKLLGINNINYDISTYENIHGEILQTIDNLFQFMEFENIENLQQHLVDIVTLISRGFHNN